MKTIFRFFFSPRDQYGQFNPVGPVALYAFIGLAAFGHNYVNYPIQMNYTQHVWIQVVDEKGVEVPGKSAWSDQEYDTGDISRSESGFKAVAAGLFWPGYLAILINEKLK